MTTSGLQDNRGPGVFDVGRLMAASAASAGQREALLTLMDRVCGMALHDLDAAWSACREGRAAQGAAAIHALRGSIGTLGATVFAATSRELEAAVRNGQPAEALYERARRELQATVAAATAWLADQPRQPAPDAALDRSALARWKSLLAAQDIDAVALYRQVKPGLAVLAGLGPAGAATIEQAMGRLDFAAVLAVLEELP
jgi:HPt (histidine-containing phosphotransfer) domain-containing protein